MLVSSGTWLARCGGYVRLYCVLHYTSYVNASNRPEVCSSSVVQMPWAGNDAFLSETLIYPSPC